MTSEPRYSLIASTFQFGHCLFVTLSPITKTPEISHDYAGVSLQVTVDLEPEEVPTFLDALWSVYEKILQEENCTLVEVYQSIEDKGQMMFKNWSASREWVTEDMYRSESET
ncbi:hypothetical protein BDW74DRAFT_182844 [Aspergillus multicolor]|uniref:uncharacterized protein n=1 Tax=Aspergillus multicolor TaxID=41759 RepID=UPI003CCCD8FD